MKRFLFFLILFGNFAFSLLSAASFESSVPHKFSVESSVATHAEQQEKTLILQNNTGALLESYRILSMFITDPNQPVVPGNVVERILRFSSSDDALAIPLDHFGFTLAVYSGDFSDDTPDRDVILLGAELIFVFDGGEVPEDMMTIKLTVDEHGAG